MALEPTVAGLTEKQTRFLGAYLSGKSISEAALAAGYPNPEQGYQALKSPRVQAAVRDYHARVIGVEGVTLAIRTYLDLMEPGKGTPPAVRKGAADSVMKIAGFMDRTDQDGPRDINEMSSDQLAAAIGKIDETLAKRSDQAIPARTQVLEHKTP